MKKIAIFLFLTFSSLANANCIDYNYNYENCNFKVPKINNNESIKLKYEKNNFYGEMEVKCSNNINIINKESCEYKPKLDLGDCAGINENNWSSNNEICHHNDLNRIIKNNDKLNIKSDTNNGDITYQCDNGKIKVESTNCNSISKTKNIGLIESKSVARQCGNYEYKENYRIWNKLTFKWEIPEQLVMEGMCSSLCKKLGYNESNNGSDWTPSGSDKTFTLECDCCNYIETTPTTNCVDSITPIDSNSATIKDCRISGTLEQSTGELTGNPSQSDINKWVCLSNDYTNLDKVISITKGQYADDEFIVVAQCSGKSTQGNSDPCRGAFIGDLNTAKNSDVPFNCENNQCWIDLCSDLEMDKDLCKDCGASSLTWADSDKIGDCTANLPNIVSGQSVKVPFFNNNYNGNVTVSCNAGDKSVLSSNCWNNCKGGVKTWGKGLDRAGNSKIGKCSFDFANANYKNGDIVSPTTSINNNGTSSFKCIGSNGQWSNTSDICNIDCPTNISWENGKCSDVVASSNDRDHGDTASLVSKDTFNKGTANATCNDGKWDLSNEICNEGCNAGTIAKNWSSCSGSISVVKSAHGTLSAYFANNNNNYNGQARLKCNDTSWDLQDTSCNIKTCAPTTLTWSETHPWGTETCSENIIGTTNVGQNKIAKDSSAYIGNATFNCVVNGTSGQYIKASGSCSTHTPIDEVCAWKRNTTGSCDSATGKRTYNEVFARVSASQYGGKTCLEKYGTATNAISGTATENCAVNCVGSWVDQSWESCKSTNEQAMIEKFIVTVTAKNGGAACSASNGSTRVNNSKTQSCIYNRNCVGSWVDNGYGAWGNWSSWGSCSNGNQMSTRTRNGVDKFVISIPAQGGGTCEAINGQIRPDERVQSDYKYQPCSLDCIGSVSWGSSCGVGNITIPNGEDSRTKTKTIDKLVWVKVGQQCQSSPPVNIDETSVSYGVSQTTPCSVLNKSVYYRDRDPQACTSGKRSYELYTCKNVGTTIVGDPLISTLATGQTHYLCNNGSLTLFSTDQTCNQLQWYKNREIAKSPQYTSNCPASAYIWADVNYPSRSSSKPIGSCSNNGLKILTNGTLTYGGGRCQISIDEYECR